MLRVNSDDIVLKRYDFIMLLCYFMCLKVMVMKGKAAVSRSIDCKTVRIFAYSSTREQSNKRSGTRVKTESKSVSLSPALASHRRPISLPILRRKKKTTVLRSSRSINLHKNLHLIIFSVYARIAS